MTHKLVTTNNDWCQRYSLAAIVVTIDTGHNILRGVGTRSHSTGGLCYGKDVLAQELGFQHGVVSRDPETCAGE